MPPTGCVARWGSLAHSGARPAWRWAENAPRWRSPWSRPGRRSTSAPVRVGISTAWWPRPKPGNSTWCGPSGAYGRRRLPRRARRGRCTEAGDDQAAQTGERRGASTSSLLPSRGLRGQQLVGRTEELVADGAKRNAFPGEPADHRTQKWTRAAEVVHRILDRRVAGQPVDADQARLVI